MPAASKDPASDPVELYGGRDPREVPTYTIAEAARYVRMPPSTLRSWTLGRPYPTLRGERFSAPLIHIADPAGTLLSFYDLVEAHVLTAIRHRHGVHLPQVRQALDYLLTQQKAAHPLADWSFATDGVDLFVERYGSLINVSKQGQLGMRAVLTNWLKRIERDDEHLARRLFPFTRIGSGEVQPKIVVIDPRVSFGRPTLAGTGIRTEIIWERYMAGESTSELADDYERKQSEIEEAIRAQAA